MCNKIRIPSVATADDHGSDQVAFDFNYTRGSEFRFDSKTSDVKHETNINLENKTIYDNPR